MKMEAKMVYTVGCSSSKSEYLVIAPSGDVEFMGFWKLLFFVFRGFGKGHDFKVSD
jgi:hypothetical protein